MIVIGYDITSHKSLISLLLIPSCPLLFLGSSLLMIFSISKVVIGAKYRD